MSHAGDVLTAWMVVLAICGAAVLVHAAYRCGTAARADERGEGQERVCPMHEPGARRGSMVREFKAVQQPGGEWAVAAERV